MISSKIYFKAKNLLHFGTLFIQVLKEGRLTKAKNLCVIKDKYTWILLFHCNKFITQSWTALFRAFSSHRQPSAIFSKVFPAEQTSWPNWQTLWACTEADA